MAKKGITLEQRTAAKQAKALEDKKKKAEAAKFKKELAAKNKANVEARKRRLNDREKKLKSWDADSEHLKEAFLDQLLLNSGEIGRSLRDIGVNRSWYRKLITTDVDFKTSIFDILEDLEEGYIKRIYTEALKGDTKAGYAYLRHSRMMKANIEYQARIQQIKEEDPSTDKAEALKLAIKELLGTYYSLKALGRDTQALTAIKQYIDLMQLTEVSDLGDYEVMTGTKLIQIMKDLKIMVPTEHTIDMNQVPEHMKDLYAQMLPTKNLEDGKN